MVLVTAINCVKVNDKMKPIKNSNFKLKADLVLLAMGFIHPTHKGMIENLALKKIQEAMFLQIHQIIKLVLIMFSLQVI